MTVAEALARFDERVFEPRQYGVNDCCVAVADVLMAAGWPDLMVPFGRRYRTARGFRRSCRRVAGAATLADAVEFAALNCGTVVFTMSPKAAPANFDLGMIFAGAPGRVVELPAFWWQGAWRGLSPDGAVYSLEAFRVWRRG